MSNAKVMQCLFHRRPQKKLEIASEEPECADNSAPGNWKIFVNAMFIDQWLI